MLRLLDDGYIELKYPWGSDEAIIEAARMSTNKGFLGWGPSKCLTCNGEGFYDEQKEELFSEVMCSTCKGMGSTEGDEKLLRYLWAHKHTSPFEMAGAVFEIQAPIFVIREWHRHRVQAIHEGFSFNEMSGRYTELPNMFYTPSTERLMKGKQSKSNKQSSKEGFSEAEAFRLRQEYHYIYEKCRDMYENLLRMGVSRELARLVLPVSQYSKMRASANLWGWLHFLGLRLDKGAQYEIRVYAEAITDILRQQFPKTLALFDEERREK